MSRPIIFPKPQQLVSKGKQDLEKGPLQVETDGVCRAEKIRQVFEIADRLGLCPPPLSFAKTAPGGWTLKISQGPWHAVRANKGRLENYQTEQGYRLEISRKRIRVTAENECGALNALKTLAHVFRKSGNSFVVEHLRISDWPDFAERGCFYESLFTTDRIGLGDWQRILAKLFLLKFNTISISLYNCWRRAADLEFLFYKFRKYPELGIKNRGYDYAANAIKEYYPKLYEEESFPAIIRHAHDLGINTIPYLSSLGHNTYLPKVFPEISMKDGNAKPISYGFCTENPKTYAILFSLYDEIIAACSLPRGPMDFGIGMDEICSFCECPACRAAGNTGPDNFVIRHIIRCAKHLKSRGIRRVFFWYDVPYWQGNYNERLMAMLEREKVKDVLTVGWWYYDNPDEEPLLSLRRGNIFRKIDARLPAFVAPSVGLDPCVLGPSLPPRRHHLASLTRLLKIGHQSRARGVLSYSQDETGKHDEYCCLSEFSWNQRNAVPKEFGRRFEEFLFGPQAKKYDRTREVYRKLMEIFGGLAGPLTSSYRIRAQAPPHIGRLLQGFSLHCRLLPVEWQRLGRKGEKAARDLEGMTRRRGISPFKSRLIQDYAHDLERLVIIIRLTYHSLEYCRYYSLLRHDLKKATACLAGMEHHRRLLLKTIGAQHKLMDTLAAARDPYLVPLLLETMNHVYETFKKYHAMFAILSGQIRRKRLDVLPVMDFYHEAFAGKDRNYHPFPSVSSAPSRPGALEALY